MHLHYSIFLDEKLKNVDVFAKRLLEKQLIARHGLPLLQTLMRSPHLTEIWKPKIKLLFTITSNIKSKNLCPESLQTLAMFMTTKPEKIVG